MPLKTKKKETNKIPWYEVKKLLTEKLKSFNFHSLNQDG